MMISANDAERRRGMFLLLAAAILWGTTGTTQALAPAGVPPLVIGAVRLLVGGGALFLLALVRGAFRDQPAFPKGLTLLAALLVALYQITFFVAVARTGVAIGTVVGIGSAPVAGGLLGRLLQGESLSYRWLCATLLAIAGCTLLALAGGGAVRIDPIGILLAIAAGASYAGYTAAVKRLLPGRSPDAVIAAIFLLGGLILAPAFLTASPAPLFSLRGLLVALHLGLVTTALSYWLFARGLMHVPISTATTLALGEPLTAALLGLLFLHEPVTSGVLGGIALIFSGLLLLALPQPRRKTG